MCLKTRVKADVLIEIIQLNRRELEIRPGGRVLNEFST